MIRTSKPMIRELRIIRSSYILWYAIVIGFVILLIQTIPELTNQSAEGEILAHYKSNIEAFCLSILFGSFAYVCPSICSMNAAFSFCDEYNSGNMLLVLTRTGHKKYVIAKIFSTALFGFCVIFIILLCFGVFVSCFYTPISAIDPESSLPLQNSIFGAFYQLQNGTIFIITEAVVGGLYGATWSILGLASAIWYPNRFVSLATPFLVSYIANIMTARYLKNEMLNPTNMLLPYEISIVPSFGYLLIFQLAMTGAFVILFILGFVWRSRKDAF